MFWNSLENRLGLRVYELYSLKGSRRLLLFLFFVAFGSLPPLLSRQHHSLRWRLELGFQKNYKEKWKRINCPIWRELQDILEKKISGLKSNFLTLRLNHLKIEKLCMIRFESEQLIKVIKFQKIGSARVIFSAVIAAPSVLSFESCHLLARMDEY